ncbi:hypothetical protein ACQ4PT_057901 [Festuca glaucescens]
MDVDGGPKPVLVPEAPPPVLIGNSGDVGWEYGKYCDPTNKSKIKCNFCGHISTGGIFRFKQHVANMDNSVIGCNKATPEAIADCKNHFQCTEETKSKKRQHEQDLRDDVHITSATSHGTAIEDVCVGSSSSEPNKLGPMDRYVHPIDGKSSKEEALRQLSMNKALFKERVHEASQYVARWVYTHAIPFNALDNDEFRKMCEAIGKFGPGYEPPSQYELREKLLSEEYARTKSLLDDHEKQKMKLGCTIMTDAWTDMKRRSIMNLCMHCSGRTLFIRSEETSNVSHTAEVIFELLDKAIEELGPAHVMQVCTDNASNNMGAKKLLLEMRPKIFWSSCATHTINLMLQGIGNIKRFKTIVDQEKNVTIFIYVHHKTLAHMRKCTKRRDIIRLGVTRFASNFLILQSMVEKRVALRAMVVDRAWEEMPIVKSKKVKDTTATLMDANFWKGVTICIKVFEPLVILLRLADGDVKPSMAWLYGEMLKAKIKIKEAFGNQEKMYKETISIVEKKLKGRLDTPLHKTAYLLNPHYTYANTDIFEDTDMTVAFMQCAEQYFGDDYASLAHVVNDEMPLYEKMEGPFKKKLATSCERADYNPVGWWKLYGTEVPKLQKMVMRILSLTSSSSGCERNWSIYEMNHTKRRNRLTTDRLNNMVYVQFNTRMMSKKQRLMDKKKADSLLSSDASEAQGWLFEGGDDHALAVFRDEEDGDQGVHPATGIPYDVLGEAMGTQDQLQLRRSARVNMRDLEEEEFISDKEDVLEEDDIEYEGDDEY